MASFQLSYKDYIRKLQKQNQEKIDDEKDKALNDIQLYSGDIFEITTTDITPIDIKHWYKKAFAKKHTYSLDVFSNEGNTENKQSNSYKELLGHKGWLYSVCGAKDTNHDFLTGYYFARILVAPVKNANHVSFHFGCSPYMISGIEKCLGRHAKWKWYGADTKTLYTYKQHYLNGVSKSGDVNNLNTIKSIRNQLSEVLAHKLTFYIQDIYPTSPICLYNSLIIPLTDVDKLGFSILRLPDPHVWDVFGSTHILNFLLFIVSQYNIVKIFKTPWSNKARYYLIFASPKEIFPLQKLTTLMKYIEDLEKTPNVYLYNEQLYDGNQEIESLVARLATMQEKLITQHEELPSNQANEIWLEQVMGYNSDTLENLIEEGKKDVNKELSIPSPRHVKKM